MMCVIRFGVNYNCLVGIFSSKAIDRLGLMPDLSKYNECVRTPRV